MFVFQKIFKWYFV